MFLILESLTDGAERMGLNKHTVKNIKFYLNFLGLENYIL